MLQVVDMCTTTRDGEFGGKVMKGAVLTKHVGKGNALVQDHVALHKLFSCHRSE